MPFLIARHIKSICKAYGVKRYNDPMISGQTIKEFQDAIKKEFGVVLNDKDTNEILYNWVAYFDLLAKIDSRKKIQTS